MARDISFLSWNIEHFRGRKARVDRVVKFLEQHDPDVFALFEVEGKTIYRDLVDALPDHHFSITESPSVSEILIGVRRDLPSFVTQKDEFQAKTPALRPGALVTLRVDGKEASLLFLHLKSLTQPRAWGLRDDMFQRVAGLKRKIDKARRKAVGDGKPANYIALGDLNTMGMAPAYNDDLDIDGAQELAYVDRRLGARGHRMRRLTKTAPATWWNGGTRYAPADLDHVYAAEHLRFRDMGGAEIAVRGWVDEPAGARRRAWLEEHSDHCAIFGVLDGDSLH